MDRSLRFRSFVLLLVPVVGLWAWAAGAFAVQAPAGKPAAPPAGAVAQEAAVAADAPKSLAIHYLEVVTANVDATCAALEKVHSVRFGKVVAELGNARTATLRGGGEIGVRAPLRPDEAPVVRPYALVDDLDAALEAVTASGGTIALGATPMAGRGRFAIYVQGGIDYGLWQK